MRVAWCSDHLKSGKSVARNHPDCRIANPAIRIYLQSSIPDISSGNDRDTADNRHWSGQVQAKGDMTMVQARWNGAVIAESDDTVVVEGNHYFPRDAVWSKYLLHSDATSHCPWKGDASYHSLIVDGETNEDAAWYYPTPKEAAAEIAGRIAFWKGVEVG